MIQISYTGRKHNPNSVFEYMCMYLYARRNDDSLSACHYSHELLEKDATHVIVEN